MSRLVSASKRKRVTCCSHDKLKSARPINMIYFDTVANLSHCIWKLLASAIIRALFTGSNEIHRHNRLKACCKRKLWSERGYNAKNVWCVARHVKI